MFNSPLYRSGYPRAGSLIKGLLTASLLLIALLAVGSVSAQGRGSFTVNSTGDAADAGIGNGVCETAAGNGVCTLRAAIQEAIANTNLDVGINFNIPTSDPGYNAQTGAWTIIPSSALPDLSKSSRLELTTMKITGPGADKLIVERAFLNFATFRIFNVTSAGDVTLSGLTIAGGQAPSNEGGGGIRKVNSGTVYITNCTLSDNRSGDGGADGGSGGGIFNASSGVVNITNSTLRANLAKASSVPAQGGGICNKIGTINVTNSIFDHNSSAYSGGGIFNYAGVVTITGSTYLNNGAFEEGGGISSFGGTVSVSNSTFYANIAFGSDSCCMHGVGGGISNEDGGTLNLTNSTLSANFSFFVGSGVFNRGTVNIKSSIIASNSGGYSGNGPDVYGAFNSNGFNFIGIKDGSTGFTLTTDRKGTIASPLNPKFDLKGLRNNGGPTQTIGLQTSSPAVDKGSSVGLTGTLTTDQRGAGFARTVDRAPANAAGGDGTDIGAFELGP